MMLESKALTKAFGSKIAVDHVDLTVNEGDFISIMIKTVLSKDSLELDSCWKNLEGRSLSEVVISLFFFFEFELGFPSFHQKQIQVL